MLFYLSFKLHLSQQLHRLLCTALAASLLAGPSALIWEWQGTVTIKCGREDRGNWGHGGLAFYSPTLSSRTHTPIMTSRDSQSAGQEQIKPVAEVVTEMLAKLSMTKMLGARRALSRFVSDCGERTKWEVLSIHEDTAFPNDVNSFSQ